MLIKLIFIGLCAGIISGFFGIGGGIILIPALIYLLGFSQKMAQGTSLAAMIPPIGLLAAIAYWQQGNIDVKASIIIALGFLIGGWIGGTYVQNIPDEWLRKSFALLMAFVAIKMWFNR